MTLTATEIVENSISIESRMKRKTQFKTEYPDYVPVFIKYYDSDIIFRNILHNDIVYTRLLFIIRQRRSISPTMGLMSLIEYDRNKETGKIRSVQVPSSKTMGELARDYLHDDGFLYINITIENVFG